MESRISGSTPVPDVAGDWDARERYWRRKLGRIRLGAEPPAEQLTRYRRATWVLTDICAVLALIFVSLFAAFRRPDVGAILAAVLLGPIVVLAWLDHALMARRVAQFTREFQEHQNRTTKPG
jgi:hypothetical protein